LHIGDIGLHKGSRIGLTALAASPAAGGGTVHPRGVQVGDPSF
jgi:hypothetical protein